MIVRTYNRRRNPASDDAVSSQDSDPFAFDNHEDDELSILPSVKRTDFQDRGGYSGNKTKRGSRVRNGVLNSGFDSESYDLNSTQESNELSSLPLTKRAEFADRGGDFGKNTKRGARVSSSVFDSDQYNLNSTQENDQSSILPKRPGFDHRGGYSGNKTKKGSRRFESDPYALDHEDDELSDLPSIKRPDYDIRGGYSGNKIRKDSRVRNGFSNSGFDSESCDLNSTQENDELSILPEKKRADFSDFGNKTKRASRVSNFGFNSDHVDELTVSPLARRADFGVKGGDFGKNTKRVSSSGFDSDPYALDYDELPKKGGDFGKKTKRGARNGVSTSGFVSDPYDLNSTQENEELSILPEKKRGVLGNKTKRGARVSNGVLNSGFDSDELSTKRADFGGFGKKIRNGFGSNPYDLNSSQENDELSILPSKKRDDYGKKPQNGTKASDSAFDLDLYDVNSSLELDELSILPSKKSRGGADFGKKKEKVVRFSNSGFNSDPYDLNSSQENDGLPMPPLRNGKNLKKGAGVSSFDPYSLDSSQEPDKLPALPPRNHRVNGANRKKPKKVDKVKHEVSDLGVSVGMATLMETQEGGEMMEHVDEVNFALDGLKKGQPARIRRASLLSLLSICGTSQQRRLLRTHGMAKTIIDAVLSLSFDDEASNLAAAALFYVFSSDKQDDHLLDSPSCIHFLIKLLNPATSDVTKNKSFTIGNKLLSLRKDDGVLQDSKVTDSTSTAITSKVEEILVSCKQMKSSDGKDKAMPRPELSPKWIALLTMEKASLSTIALEDTVSGNIRKGGSRFKERLRELGGLNAVFEVARTCHSVMERCDEQHLFSSPGSKDSKDIESLVVLLKCLKIMENATFLSNDNQCHLLEMKGSLDDQGSPRNFVKLILSITKLLSGLSLSSSSSSGQDGKKVHSLPNEADRASEIPLLRGPEADSDEVIFISSSSMECTSSQKNFSLSQNSRWLSNGSSNSGSLKSSYETSTTSAAETCLLMAKPSSSGSCSEIPISSSCANPSTSYGLGINLGLGKRCKITEDPKVEILGNADDPFAFDEDEFEPSKWDLIYGEPAVSQPKSKGVMCTDLENNCQPIMLSSQQESSNHENHHSDASDGSSSSILDEEKSSLLADCLLAAIKVLMNLTNDNPKGCRQIGSSGGLETLSSIIASHFPSFSSSLPSFSELEDYSLSSKSSLEVENPGGSHLSDQDLDFLVAILGLLVNLVEKDEENRYRLAAASVALPSIEWLQEERHSGVIPLLCSIFLTNQGVGETAGGEGKALSWDDEEAVLQGEKEAEKMIVEAYSALLLAFLSTESKSTRSSIAKCLPDHKLAILVPVLERFVEFHLTLNMISGETHKAVLEVIESCRIT